MTEGSQTSTRTRTRTRTPAAPGYSSPEPPPPRGVLHWIAAGISGLCGIVAMAVVVALSPLVSFFTGAVRLLYEIRDTAVRPRPFKGAVHGLPFLDPPPAPKPAPAEKAEREAEPARS